MHVDWLHMNTTPQSPKQKIQSVEDAASTIECSDLRMRVTLRIMSGYDNAQDTVAENPREEIDHAEVWLASIECMLCEEDQDVVDFFRAHGIYA